MERDGVFRKAGASETGGCVEVAADQEGVRVRDSKRRDGDTLNVSDQDWRSFLAGVKDGEFDLP